MASIAKTVVATGASSGLGFEAIKQLLHQQQPYRFFLGARDVAKTQAAYNALKFDESQHSVDVLPLQLSDLKSVKTFSQDVLKRVESGHIDYLLLNAAQSNGAGSKDPPGPKWCESYIVNHLSQHYLTHLLRAKLVDSKARLVFVSSGAVQMVKDPNELDSNLKDGSGAGWMTVYSQSKFAALLGAHWWRRTLKDQCIVVAVSPGFVPSTGLSRGAGEKAFDPQSEEVKAMLIHAKTMKDGGASILAALSRTDLPTDEDQIFLTSWGAWWDKKEIALTLDKALQDKWCPSQEAIEEEIEEGNAA
ncbi:hypothetical protein DFH06DRAFT_1131852 [Mycena polygramma]|nr:hypothetical protein DFH06DRAFT_1131852 [Mycena polygramma]